MVVAQSIRCENKSFSECKISNRPFDAASVEGIQKEEVRNRALCLLPRLKIPSMRFYQKNGVRTRSFRRSKILPSGDRVQLEIGIEEGSVTEITGICQTNCRVFLSQDT